MKSRAALLAVLLLATGCATAPSSSERIDFDSANYGFLNEVMTGDAGQPQGVWGYLMTPDSPPPWPAVILLHSASGPGSQDWFYAELLRDAGYAAFVVDSFGARGVTRTVDDQTLVTEASILADAFAARRALAADPRIDGDSIALVGFSKGGIAALYGALETIRAAYGGDRFAAHAAFYPWCGLRPLDTTTTGAPVLIQMGDNDNVTPAVLCRDLVASMAGEPVDLVIYPGARHAFDHPTLDGLDWVPVTGMIPSDCLIEETGPGVFVERTTGDTVDGASLGDVLTACGRRGAEAGGNAEAAAAAQQALLDFLAAAFSP
ncbi:MAG: dienelactone hydrolase family protein [Pseudomonadota bacterium]